MSIDTAGNTYGDPRLCASCGRVHVGPCGAGLPLSPSDFEAAFASASTNHVHVLGPTRQERRDAFTDLAILHFAGKRKARKRLAKALRLWDRENPAPVFGFTSTTN